MTTGEKSLTVRPEQAVEKAPRDVVAQATAQANELIGIVDKKQLYAEIEGKKYLVAEAWETIGAFNRTHAVTRWVQPVERSGEIVGYEAYVDLYKDGELVGGAAMTCGLDEFPCRGKEGEAKHKAARSAAQTWATSKAYRMNFSFVAVLAGYEPTPAEEIMGPTVSSEHFCPIHNVPFEKKQKGKAVWWAHKTADGKWCNEAQVKKEEEEQGQSEEASEPSQDESTPPYQEEEFIPQTFDDLAVVICDKMKWKSTTPVKSWLINKFKIAESRLEDDILGVWKEVRELMGW